MTMTFYRTQIFLLLLFTALSVSGCLKPGASPEAGGEASGDGAGLALSSSAASTLPLPSEAELDLVGQRRDVSAFRWHLDSPMLVIASSPQRLLAAPTSAAFPVAATAILQQNVPLFPAMLPLPMMERTLVSSRMLMLTVAAPNGERSLQPYPAKVTEVTLVEPTTPEEFLARVFPSIKSIPTVQSGRVTYYDIGGVAQVPPPLAIGIAFPEPRTVLIVEGDSSTITEAFDDAPPRGALIDRLQRTDLSEHDLTAALSREGVVGQDSMVPLFSQFVGLPESLVATLADVKAVVLTVRLDPPTPTSDDSEATLLEIALAAPSETDSRSIEEQLQGWLLGNRVALSSATEEQRQAWLCPAAFPDEILGAIRVTTSVAANGGAALVRVCVPRVASWDETVRQFLTSRDRELAYQDTFQRLSVFAQAFVQYQRTNGFFPHRGIRAADGTPLLSWRVVILPLLGEAELFSQFAIDQPWDSEQNKPLAEKMPAIFGIPNLGSESEVADVSTKTVFRLFNTGAAPFAQDSLRPQQITAPNATAMFVAVDPTVSVVWTAPDTLAHDDATLDTLFPREFLAYLWSGDAFVSKEVPRDAMHSLIEGTLPAPSPTP